MPPKLADEIRRAHVILPEELAERIDQWRGRELCDSNFSEAIRRLIELGLEGTKKKHR